MIRRETALSDMEFRMEGADDLYRDSVAFRHLDGTVNLAGVVLLRGACSV